MRLIDADAFKAYMRSALEQTRRCYPDGGEWAEAVTEEFCRDIDEQPTVQPERKPGRWLFGFDNKYLEKFYYCSNCGCRKYREDEPSDYFCSNCGADMRGGDSNE